MARNATVPVPKATWTQLTNASASAIRAQNQSSHVVSLMATTTAVAPTDFEGCLELEAGEILATDITLAELWPGVTTPSYVWAYSPIGAFVSVSHA